MSNCGCGKRAVKVRDVLGLKESEFTTEYVEASPTKATLNMVAYKLNKLLNKGRSNGQSNSD